MENKELNQSEEIQFLRKALMETSKISYGWMKTLKIAIAVISIAFSIIIISGFIVCQNIVNKYLAYAYAPDAIEQSNTNTNINSNTNENK